MDDKLKVGEELPKVNGSDNVKLKDSVNSEEMDVNQVNQAKNVKFVWLGSSKSYKKVDGSNGEID